MCLEGCDTSVLITRFSCETSDLVLDERANFCVGLDQSGGQIDLCRGYFSESCGRLGAQNIRFEIDRRFGRSRTRAERISRLEGIDSEMSRQEAAHGTLQCFLDTGTELARGRSAIENLIQRLANPLVSRGAESKYAMIALIGDGVVQPCGKAEKRNHDVERVGVRIDARHGLLEAAVAGAEGPTEEEGVDEKTEIRLPRCDDDTKSLRLQLIGCKPEIIGSENAGCR